MVIVKIIGGLGNQLFQYAFGKYIEKGKDTKVMYDTQTSYVAQNFTSRNLDIEKFKIKLPIASDLEIRKYIHFRHGLLWRIERKLTQIHKNINNNYCIQKNAHSDLTQLKLNTYYDGYWQCYQYADEVRDILLEEFTAPQSFYQKHEEVLNQMRDSSSVAIHIRRGDYIKIKANAMLFEVCDMDYYNEAIKELTKVFHNPQFFIFTQDKEWARDNFTGNNFSFVEGNTAMDDMLLMAQCQNNIIANSTFSWWSAWLNKNPNKIIIAPKKWYKGKMNVETINLIPKTWLRI